MFLVPPARSAKLPLLLSVLCAACDGEPGSTQWTGRRDTVGGVEIVRNPGQPLLESGELVAESLWTASNTGPDGFWERPHWLALSGDRVYILDLQAHRVFILDAGTGAAVGSVGREGAGPGEFRRPFGVGVYGDELLVGNGGGPGLVVYGVDGSYHRNVRFGFRPFGFEVLSDGHLLVLGLGGPKGARWLVGLDGAAEPYEPTDSSLIEPSLVFGDCPRYGVDDAGVLRVECRHLAFQELATDGNLRREVRVARPPLVASDEELGFQEERLRRSMSRSGLPGPELNQYVKRQMERARIKAVYNGVRSDPGTGWVYVLEQNPPDLPSGPATLHAFDAVGRYMAVIAFERSWEDYRVSDDVVYALARDPETGLIAAAAYRLSRTR